MLRGTGPMRPKCNKKKTEMWSFSRLPSKNEDVIKKMDTSLKACYWKSVRVFFQHICDELQRLRGTRHLENTDANRSQWIMGNPVPATFSSRVDVESRLSVLERWCNNSHPLQGSESASTFISCAVKCLDDSNSCSKSSNDSWSYLIQAAKPSSSFLL